MVAGCSGRIVARQPPTIHPLLCQIHSLTHNVFSGYAFGATRLLIAPTFCQPTQRISRQKLCNCISANNATLDPVLAKQPKHMFGTTTKTYKRIVSKRASSKHTPDAHAPHLVNQKCNEIRVAASAADAQPRSQFDLFLLWPTTLRQRGMTSHKTHQPVRVLTEPCLAIVLSPELI